MFLFRVLTAVLTIAFIAPAWADSHGHSEAAINVINPWTRVVPMAGMNAAGYMVLKNNTDQAITLKSFRTDAASKASLHETIKSGSMVSMRALPDGIIIPANSKIELHPGGLHLMLLKIKQPLTEGKEISVTLEFESGKEVTSALVVRAMGSMEGHSEMGH